MSTPIHFLKVKDPYGCFSNFSPHPITLWGRPWKTSEAAYQASKFHIDSYVFDAIWKVATPREAATIGRTAPDMVPYWESFDLGHLERILDPIGATHLIGVKVDDGRGATPAIERYKDAVMYLCLHHKAEQHKFIRQTLLDTGDRTITEAFHKESYWAWGPDRKGLGKLGKLWMLLRSELRKAEANAPKEISPSELAALLEGAE